MQLSERPDLDNIKYGKSLTLEEYISFVTKDDDVKVKTKAEREVAYNINKKYCNDMIKCNGEITKLYSQKEGRGRYYCSDSIQTMPSAIRGFYMRKKTTDLDCVLCYPRILANICRQNNITCPNLEYFINHRTEMVVNLPTIKTDVMSYINNSNARTSNPFLSNFKAECKAIHTQLFGIPKYAKHLEASKGSDNEIGSAMFRVLEDVELDIILKLKAYLISEKNIEPAVMCHDGMLLYGDFYEDKQLLDDVETYIESHFKGLGMKFAYKKHCDKIQRPESFDPDAEVEDEDMNDNDVAEALFKQHGHKIIINKGVPHAYYKHTWEQDVKMVFKQWVSVCNYDILKGSGGKKRKLVKSQTQRWNYYIEQLSCMAIDRLENVNVLDKEKDTLAFSNGVYSFKTKAFEPYDESKTYYFTQKINRKYPTEINDEAKKRVHAVLLDIFNGSEDLMDEVFSFQARGLSGHVEDKVGLCMVGLRNSAKGFIMFLMSEAFVGVMGSIDSDELVHKKNSSESVERRNGFLGNLCENKICISEEVRVNTDLDGKMWKTIASGGDKVTYRSAFGLKCDGFVRALYTITCNKVPTFDVADAKENLLICNMPCKFVEELPTVPEGGQKINRGFSMKKADPSIKDKFATEEYIDAFTMFVLGFYKDEKPKYLITSEMGKDNSEVVDDNYDEEGDALSLCVKKLYKITKDKTHVVKCSDVHKTIINEMKDMTPQIIKVFLMGEAVPVEKTKGSNHYIGLSLITVEKDEEEKKSMFKARS